jgi:hypothetical protein
MGTKPAERHGALKGRDVLFWKSVVMDLEQGEFPDLICLSSALKGTDPIPPVVREWLANFFAEGMPRPRSGRKRKYNALQRRLISSLIRQSYSINKREVEAERAQQRVAGTLQRGRRGPSDEALVRTQRDLAAAGDKMSVASIRDAILGRGSWKT